MTEEIKSYKKALEGATFNPRTVHGKEETPLYQGQSRGLFERCRRCGASYLTGKESQCDWIGIDPLKGSE